jgi:hypothetical protein
VASLLQLDIKDAFYIVIHTRLLDTLVGKGFSGWGIHLVRSFLRLRFDVCIYIWVCCAGVN